MDTYQFIIALITAITAQAVTIYKYLQERNKNKKKIDDLQNSKLNEMEKKQIDFDKEFNELKTLVFELKDMVKQFIEIFTIEHDIQNIIELKAEQIIDGNPNLEKDMKSLLIAGRNATVHFAKWVYFTKIELTPEIIANECASIFNNLKLLCNTYFKEEKVYKQTTITFNDFLKNNTQINQITIILNSKILEFKKGEYNGNSKQKFLIIFSEFLSDIYKESIKAYDKFNRL